MIGFSLCPFLTDLEMSQVWRQAPNWLMTCSLCRISTEPIEILASKKAKTALKPKPHSHLVLEHLKMTVLEDPSCFQEQNPPKNWPGWHEETIAWLALFDDLITTKEDPPRQHLLQAVCHHLAGLAEPQLLRPVAQENPAQLKLPPKHLARRN